MTKDEVLRLAWDALEDIGDEWGFTSERTVPKRKEAITAIKEALAQPEQDGKCKYCTDGCPACDARKLPEQPPYHHFVSDRFNIDPQTGNLNIGAVKKQEPVAWLITDEKINSLQVDSIQRLIDRARHAHMTDIKLRINGQDEWFQADWLKHLTRTTPPQRKPLTDEEIWEALGGIDCTRPMLIARVIEAKLKAKNVL